MSNSKHNVLPYHIMPMLPRLSEKIKIVLTFPIKHFFKNHNKLQCNYSRKIFKLNKFHFPIKMCFDNFLIIFSLQ